MLLNIFVYLVLFFISGALSFSLESDYEKMIRFFYQTFTYHRISYHIPAKYIRFPSFGFIVSPGLFLILYYHFLKIKKTNFSLLKNLLPFIIAVVSLLLTCYVASNSIIINCTQCIDGQIELQYSDLPYDAIFIWSLGLGSLPLILTFIPALKRKSKPALKSRDHFKW